MVRVITNNFRARLARYSEKRENGLRRSLPNEAAVLPANAKYLAWGIFLIFFIENGTLGLFPQQMYFVYRNMRISDFLIYGLTIYSFTCAKEFRELLNSKALNIAKIILFYFLFRFIVSSIQYEINPIEFFFRLKGLWSSFLVFPYLLLLKRKGFMYMAKLILPVAIVSNILYIMSALTGIAFLPEIGIEKQNLPGGLQVYRVFGGTFYGEVFFLWFIFNWITKKFRWYQLFLVILFVIPHILAFGRSAWIYFSFTILTMPIWYTLKKRNFKLALKNAVLIIFLCLAVIYAFIQFVPQSERFTEALGARLLQGQEDYLYKEGTYGSRLANTSTLIKLWLDGNIFFGIGMHPLWVIKPLTVEENIIAWGFSDLGWVSVLAAYGLVGFILALLFQILYFLYSYKIMKTNPNIDILTFFVLVFFAKLFFDSVISFSYTGLTIGLFGFYSVSFYVAALVYKYEHPEEYYGN